MKIKGGGESLPFFVKEPLFSNALIALPVFFLPETKSSYPAICSISAHLGHRFSF